MFYKKVGIPETRYSALGVKDKVGRPIEFIACVEFYLASVVVKIIFLYHRQSSFLRPI